MARDSTGDGEGRASGMPESFFLAQRRHRRRARWYTLEDLRAVIQAHPRLRADVQVLHLQEDLASTENRIAAARRHYTFSVMRYHLARESFPQNVVARVAGFGPATYLELDAR